MTYLITYSQIEGLDDSAILEAAGSIAHINTADCALLFKSNFDIARIYDRIRKTLGENASFFVVEASRNYRSTFDFDANEFVKNDIF